MSFIGRVQSGTNEICPAALNLTHNSPATTRAFEILIRYIAGLRLIVTLLKGSSQGRFYNLLKNSLPKKFPDDIIAHLRFL